ncbi:MAG: trypsin-like peptidase domain-containing protein [Bacteroidales bacterium]|nr:trypsin-like peptidase domain-containing protein [Bacteroidales bacterium]
MRKTIVIIILSAIVSGGVSWYVADKVVSKYADIAEVEREVLRKGDEKEARRPARKAESISGFDFSDAAEMAVNTVVYVKVVKKARYQAPSSVLDFLFGFANTPKDEYGLGSGVIITEDGYIVTNNHVISGADEVEITTYDNKVYAARVIGTDPATDIALLKVDAENLQAIELGDSDDLRLGEWVLAIGSPYDLRSTITAGIVSAKGRAFPNYDGKFRVESFIQTDAAVNPGNSGGALVNTAGQLVGINTSIISLTGSYSGYSFAVPVNIVKRVTDDMIQYGEVRRVVLGISMADSNDGVVVMEVQPSGLADGAGIKSGDILKEINLNPVGTASEVQEQVNRLRPGEKAVITIVRDGTTKEVMINM